MTAQHVRGRDFRRGSGGGRRLLPLAGRLTSAGFEAPQRPPRTCTSAQGNGHGLDRMASYFWSEGAKAPQDDEVVVGRIRFAIQRWGSVPLVPVRCYVNDAGENAKDGLLLLDSKVGTANRCSRPVPSLVKLRATRSASGPGVAAPRNPRCPLAPACSSCWWSSRQPTRGSACPRPTCGCEPPGFAKATGTRRSRSAPAAASGAWCAPWSKSSSLKASAGLTRTKTHGAWRASWRTWKAGRPAAGLAAAGLGGSAPAARPAAARRLASR